MRRVKALQKKKLFRISKAKYTQTFRALVHNGLILCTSTSLDCGVYIKDDIFLSENFFMQFWFWMGNKFI